MSVSRRKMLLTGTAAVLAIPVTKQVIWSTQDFTRDGFDASLPKVGEDKRAWMNWSGLHKATPQQFATPRNVQELADFVKTAPAPLRPVGSGHSFTALVPTGGSIIDVSAMSGLISHDPEANRATLGAGTRLQHAGRLLSNQKLSLANLPDIDVQTLAGGFNTGTHGTGRELTALHDYVQGFEMVTAAGDILNVTHASNPDLFAAGKVSLGALGIITKYDLKVEPIFKLHRRVSVENTPDILDHFEERTKQHRNFETLILPNTGYGAVLAHDLNDGEITRKAISQDDDVLGDLKMLRDVFGWWPWLRRKVFINAMDVTQVEDATDEAWKLLATSRPSKFNEMEYHIPLENGVATLREIVAKMETRRDAFYPVEARITAPDDAWLSPFNDGPRISIAIHADASEDYGFFFKDFEPIFRKAGGRPHWGKLHSLNAADLANLYPRFADFVELRQQMDPNNRLMNPFLTKILKGI